MSVSLLKSRHGVYYLRLVHPREVASTKRETRISLRTKDRKAASRILAERLMGLSSGATEHIAKRQTGEPAIHAVHDFASERPSALVLPQSARTDAPLLDVIQTYLDSRSEVSSSTRLSDRSKCMLFFRVVESQVQNPRVSDISVATMRAYSEQLRLLPRNLATAAPLRGEVLATRFEDRMAPKTRFSHARAVKAFLEWSDRNFYAVSVDILTILKGHLTKPKQIGRRVSLTDREVLALLSSERVRDTARVSDHWLPLLAAYTGARQAELCQLHSEDIYEDPHTKLWVFNFRNGEGKRFKTAHSIRIIPMHPILVAARFLHFVAQRKLHGATRLFDEPRNSKGEFSAYSKRFNRLRKGMGIIGGPSQRKDFHSFRHSFIAKLKALSCPPYVINSITGHSSEEMSESFTTYGLEALPLPLKYRFVSNVTYQDDNTV